MPRSKNSYSLGDFLVTVLSLGLVKRKDSKKPGQPVTYFNPDLDSVTNAKAQGVNMVLEELLTGPVTKMAAQANDYYRVRHQRVIVAGDEFGDLLTPSVRNLQQWWIDHRKKEVSFKRGKKIRGKEIREDADLVKGVYGDVSADATLPVGGALLEPQSLLKMFEDPDGFVDFLPSLVKKERDWLMKVKILEAVSGAVGSIAGGAATAWSESKIPLSTAVWAHSSMASSPNTWFNNYATAMTDKPGYKLVADAMADAVLHDTDLAGDVKKKNILSEELLKGLEGAQQEIRSKIKSEFGRTLGVPYDQYQTKVNSVSGKVIERTVKNIVSRSERLSGLGVDLDLITKNLTDKVFKNAEFRANVENMYKSGLFTSPVVRLFANTERTKVLALDPLKLEYQPKKAEAAFDAASALYSEFDPTRANEIQRGLETAQKFGQRARTLPYERGGFSLTGAYLGYKFISDYKKNYGADLTDPVEWFTSIIKGGGNFYKLAGAGISHPGNPLFDNYRKSLLSVAATYGGEDALRELKYFGSVSRKEGELNISDPIGGVPGSIMTMPTFMANMSWARWSYMAGAMHPFQVARNWLNGDLPFMAHYIGTGFLDPEVLEFLADVYKKGGLISSPETLMALEKLLKAKFGKAQGQLMAWSFKIGTRLMQSDFYKKMISGITTASKYYKWITAPQMKAFEHYVKWMAPKAKKVLSFAGKQMGKLAARFGIKGATKAMLKTIMAITTNVAWVAYEAINMLSGGALDKAVVKTIYYSFLFTVFASITFLLLLFSPFYLLGQGTNSLTTVAPGGPLRVVPIKSGVEYPDAYVAVGSPVCSGATTATGVHPDGGTSFDDAECPLMGTFRFTQCGHGGFSHKGSGATDVVPSVYRLRSPVNGLVTYCNTAQNCGCGTQGAGGGAIIVYSEGYYYIFLHVKPLESLCADVASGGQVFVKKGDLIVDDFYRGKDACTTGIHLHFNIKDAKTGLSVYNQESCRFLVDKCGGPTSASSDCPSDCK